MEPYTIWKISAYSGDGATSVLLGSLYDYQSARAVARDQADSTACIGFRGVVVTDPAGGFTFFERREAVAVRSAR